MNNWLVVHNLLSYSQHKDLIGCAVKQHGKKQPKSSAFSSIKKGDNVVYYATKDFAIVGIFQVTSDMTYFESDPDWKESVVYQIKEKDMPPQGTYLDFKKLVKDPSSKFDLFPEKQRWGIHLLGKTVVLLTERDYLTIKNTMSNSTFLKAIVRDKR